MLLVPVLGVFPNGKPWNRREPIPGARSKIIHIWTGFPVAVGEPPPVSYVLTAKTNPPEAPRLGLAFSLQLHN